MGNYLFKEESLTGLDSWLPSCVIHESAGSQLLNSQVITLSAEELEEDQFEMSPSTLLLFPKSTGKLIHH